MTDDFQDNFFGNSTFLVEILVKNNSGKVLAGPLSPVVSPVALGAAIMEQSQMWIKLAHSCQPERS